MGLGGGQPEPCQWCQQGPVLPPRPASPLPAAPGALGSSACLQVPHTLASAGKLFFSGFHGVVPWELGWNANCASAQIYSIRDLTVGCNLLFLTIPPGNPNAPPVWESLVCSSFRPQVMNHLILGPFRSPGWGQCPWSVFPPSLMVSGAVPYACHLSLPVWFPPWAWELLRAGDLSLTAAR